MDAQDSDEAPYSDSDSGDLNDDGDRLTSVTTMNSGVGKKQPDSLGDIPDESASGPSDAAFPQPPARQGVQLVSDQQQQPKSNMTSDQKHTVGGLSQQKSEVLIHRKAVPDHNAAEGDNKSDSASLAGSSIYRSAGLKSNLAEWAPSAQPPSGPWAGISNLPDWNTIKKNEPTAKPIVNIQRDLDWSMRRLMSEGVFEQLVNDELGRHRFREFLAQSTGNENKLDMYFDLCQYNKQNEAIRGASEALHDVYLAQDSNSHIPIPDQLSDDFYDTLKKQFQVRPSLEPLKQHLLNSLYQSDFKLFVKARLVEQYKVKLGSFAQDGDQSGLGDCYCLTNPRLRENPIVLVSPGFEQVTGYLRQQIIGRNCRFLQGPGTNPESVQRIRDALNAGDASTELLLNYRRDGSPFFCLLTIIPLRDATGSLVYFIGGQTNVNGQMSGGKGLKFLLNLGDTGDVTHRASPPTFNGHEVSPSLARHMQNGQAFGDDSGHMMTKSSSHGSVASKRGLAAGAYDPLSQTGPNATMAMTPAVNKSSSPKTGGAIGRFFSGSSSKKERLDSIDTPTQRLLGAEGSMRKDPYSLEDQMEYFTALYSKLIIFKRTKREIIFATRGCISYFNLPCSDHHQLYNSPLIHADLLSIVQGTNKEETKMVQRAIQVAVRKGESISVKTGIKQVKVKRNLFGGKSGKHDWINNQDNVKFTTLHITPLRDRDNSSFAFVALFG
jgi:PAS domain S-box-containing protein